MTIQCLKCHKPAVTFIRYNGTHLCHQHFIDYVKRRVKKELKKQGKTEEKSHIGVAISGGKDSTVALYLIHEVFGHRPNITLSAITVDEGIASYRGASIQVARKTCKNLDIPHYIVSFKDTIGWSMDEIVLLQDELGECSFCGVFRRFCLNTKSKELGITKLVTGHNLDDVTQSILMNFVGGDMQKLARLGPHKKVQPGLVPRVMPLRVIPEKEVMLYALLNEIEFHLGECPYAVRASRRYYRDIIDSLEENNPGTRHSILNSYESIKDFLLKQFPPVDLRHCPQCGEPTSQEICKSCLLLDKLENR